jgi:prolyl-tRNA synthetase
VEKKAAEVGNIFNFGSTKSEELDLFFNDDDGTPRGAILGSYGIGIGRLMGVLVEVFADGKGIIWPETVAPFRVHLIGITDNESRIQERVEQVYRRLKTSGTEVLYDDREGVSPGQKFADADLIGIPWRVVVSEKTGTRVEVKKRDKDKPGLIDLNEFLSKLKKSAQ